MLIGENLYSALAIDFANKINEKHVRISIGNFFYQDSEMMSAYSALLKNELKIALGEQENFRIIARDNLKDIMKEKRFQSLGLMDPSAKTTKISIDGIDAILRGRFFYKNRIVTLYPELVTLKDGSILSNSIEIPDFKINCDIIPSNFKESFDNAKSIKGIVGNLQNGFKLDLATKESKKEYKEGEAIHFQVKSEIDANIALFAHFANGETVLLYPNAFSKNEKLKAGKTVVLPDENKPEFEIFVQAPFGCDVIQVVASDKEIGIFQKLKKKIDLLDNKPYAEISREEFAKDFYLMKKEKNIKIAEKHIILSTFK